MRLNLYLNELFNTNIPVKTTWQSPEDWASEFEVAGNTYEFNAQYDQGFKFWDINFQNMTSIGTGYEIEGGGNALAVFSGVKKSMEKFLKKYEPEKFSFTSKFSERSRVKLYDKFTKMIAKRFKYKTKKTLEAGSGADIEVTYQFTK
jgi:hypothetical protein